MESSQARIIVITDFLRVIMSWHLRGHLTAMNLATVISTRLKVDVVMVVIIPTRNTLQTLHAPASNKKYTYISILANITKLHSVMTYKNTVHNNHIGLHIIL